MRIMTSILALAISMGPAPLDAQENRGIRSETLAAAADAAQVQEQPASPTEDASDVEGVVVTARRPVRTIARRPPPNPDPFTFFSEFCFEANRLNGRSARPVGDPAWKPLDASMRQQLKISDPSTVAYGRFDPELGPALILRIEERRPRGRLIEHRCSLTILGADDQPKFVDKMEALFDGQGTQKHVGHNSTRGDYQTMPSWQQWLWSAIPQVGSKDWRVHGGRGNKTFIIVVDRAGFYRRKSYVAGDLKYNESTTSPITLLVLTHTFRQRT